MAAMTGPHSHSLTVILPIWNEQDAIARVLAELLATSGLATAHVLAMDDGSTDHTSFVLDQAAMRDPRMEVIHLPHGGKDRALWRAFAVATTEWVCVMDADGQYDPADITRLMAHAFESHAAGVWGVRAAREDNSWRKLSSCLGRQVKRLIIGIPAVKDSGCGLFVARRDLCLRIATACPNPAGQVHCHLADIIRSHGSVVGEIPITHRVRQGGTAKYGMLNRMMPGLKSLFQARRLQTNLKHE